MRPSRRQVDELRPVSLERAVVKYAVPGRRLKAAVPMRTLVVGGMFAVVGFFVIPVVGVLVGFPIGVYVALGKAF